MVTKFIKILAYIFDWRVEFDVPTCISYQFQTNEHQFHTSLGTHVAVYDALT